MSGTEEIPPAPVPAAEYLTQLRARVAEAKAGKRYVEAYKLQCELEEFARGEKAFVLEKTQKDAKLVLDDIKKQYEGQLADLEASWKSKIEEFDDKAKASIAKLLARQEAEIDEFYDKLLAESGLNEYGQDKLKEEKPEEFDDSYNEEEDEGEEEEYKEEEKDDSNSSLKAESLESDTKGKKGNVNNRSVSFKSTEYGRETKKRSSMNKSLPSHFCESSLLGQEVQTKTNVIGGRRHKSKQVLDLEKREQILLEHGTSNSIKEAAALRLKANIISNFEDEKDREECARIVALKENAILKRHANERMNLATKIKANRLVIIDAMTNDLRRGEATMKNTLLREERRIAAEQNKLRLSMSKGKYGM